MKESFKTLSCHRWAKAQPSQTSAVLSPTDLDRRAVSFQEVWLEMALP